jgi:hypothetical protein
VVQGYPTVPTGKREIYKVNGLACFIISLATLLAAFYFDWFDWLHFGTHYLSFITAAQIMPWIVATILYLKGAIYKEVGIWRKWRAFLVENPVISVFFVFLIFDFFFLSKGFSVG